MEKQVKKGKIAVIGMFVLGMVVMTITGAVAWFSYSKNGTKTNSITSGTITFHYDEVSQGLSLRDAMPMTDAQGKAQTNYFEFDVTSDTSSTAQIPYYITVNKMTGSDSGLDSYIKVYLTKMVNGEEVPVTLTTGNQISKYSQLSGYANTKITIPATEKMLYKGLVPANSSNYKEIYRLRMWIDYGINMNSNNDGVSPYNGSTYTLKVNVYGEGVAAGVIESCPGCVYTYTTNELIYNGTEYTTYKNDGTTYTNTILTPTQYKTNYQDVVTESGKNYFLGLKLDNLGTIEKAYACGIKDGIPFCIEGTTNGSTYPVSETLLYTLYGTNACEDLGFILACTGSVNANAGALGGMLVYLSNSDKCTAARNGYASCS